MASTGNPHIYGTQGADAAEVPEMQSETKEGYGPDTSLGVHGDLCVCATVVVQTVQTPVVRLKLSGTTHKEMNFEIQGKTVTDIFPLSLLGQHAATYQSGRIL